MEEGQAWRKIKYKEKFSNAFRGLRVFWATTKNLKIHALAALLVIILGFVFSISALEHALIIFAIGLVFITEALNTAIEIDINLTSPEYHPYARDTKDVAAAAVLLASAIAVIVGLLVFLPKIF